MYRDAFDELAEAAERRRRQAKLTRLMKRANEQLAEAQSVLAEAATRLAKEDRDVARIERVSITSVLGRITGRLEEWKATEVAEAAAAEADHAAALADVAQLQEQLAEMRTESERLGDTRAAYEQAFQEKAQSLIDRGGPEAKRVAELSSELLDARSLLKELGEAFASGSLASQYVRDAAREVPAKNTTTVFTPIGNVMIPIVSDNTLSAYVESLLTRAQKQTLHFERELLDLEPWTGTETSVLPNARLVQAYARDLSRPGVQGKALDRTRSALQKTAQQLTSLLRWLGTTERETRARHDRLHAAYVEQVTHG